MATGPDSTGSLPGDDHDGDSTVSAPGEGGAALVMMPGGGRIGPYRLFAPIGRGGMGQVWRAEAAESCPVPTGREVALKLLHRVSPEERRRAAREVAYLQALHHPGIVRVLDFGEHQGRSWIVMALVEGRRLDKVMGDEGPFASDRAARIAIGALEALHVAHLAGILHRDLKPGNLMLREDGQVVVLDFGLAAAPEFESRLTASDTVIGTPAYMSPEQAAGERAAISQRSDVYAIGAVLYEMVTGTAPFAADDPRALLRRVIEDPVAPPSLRRSGVPRDMETIILRAMAKDPLDRYRSAEAMASDLRRFLEGRPPRATRPGPVMPFLRGCWRRRRTVAMAGLAAFVVFAVAALGARAALARLRPQPATPPPAVEPEWVTELVQVEPLLPPGMGGGGKLRLLPRPTLGAGIHIAILPPVAGAVRLAATITPLATAFDVRLLVSDVDINRGYAARLSGNADGARLELLREGKTMGKLELPAQPVGTPVRMALLRGENSLEIRLGDDASGHTLPFLDLVPLEGADAAGAFVIVDPGMVRVGELVLERQRQGLVVSALAPADMLRQDGRNERALSLYDAFIADHPDSPLTRDAQLRAGLCLESLGRDQLALERFQRVVQDNRLDRRYVLLSTFHAWSCVLRLGRLDEAERYFAALRQEYRADQLLAHVPVDLARQLVDDHLNRADRMRTSDPARALDLFVAGADVADYLDLRERAATGFAGAGDLLMGMGDAAQALQRYAQVVEDPKTPPAWRIKARLKTAEAMRVDGRALDAIEAYNVVIADPAAGDLLPWAQLWLGDLYHETGANDESRTVLAAAAASPSMAGRFAKALLGLEPLPAQPPADPWFANDDAFIRARLAERDGDRDAFVEHLRAAAATPISGDWPAPLAQQILNRIAP